MDFELRDCSDDKLLVDCIEVWGLLLDLQVDLHVGNDIGTILHGILFSFLKNCDLSNFVV